jgi:uncharacterized membrane protein
MIGIHSAMLLVTAMSAALVAGIFYAFSSFVMAALGRLPSEQGIDAMNAINVTVYTPSFMILFMGTTLLCGILAVWSLFSIGSFHSQLVLAASLLFVVGCFGFTILFNVPLNKQLAAATADNREMLWQDFLRDWTTWNTVRTIGATVSAALFILALLSGSNLAKMGVQRANSDEHGSHLAN